MPKKKSYLTATDQFCGCGGSSSGAKKVLDKVGGEIKLALNHWKLAIETHNTNFPDTLHDCTDVSACDPRRYPSTDILITSPECTTHSPAGGNNHKTLKKQMELFDSGKIDPATERSRATMWDVCRFAEYHNYNIIIVENVVEAKTRWALFDVWLSAMHKLGYNHQCVYLNSMHCHPTPQSRDRMYVVFWKKGNKAPNLHHTPASWCPRCEKNILAVQTWKNSQKQYGKYRQQYVYCCSTCTSTVDPYYYASFNCIDWSDLGQRIGDRPKKYYDTSFQGKNWLHLAPNSLKRVQYGLEKYGLQPILIQTSHGSSARAVWRSVFEPGFSQTTTAGQAVINNHLLVENGISGKARSVAKPFSTATAVGVKNSLLTVPFIIKGEHTLKDASFYVKSTADQFQTQTVRHSQSIVSLPFLVEMHSKGKARAATREINTVTSGAAKTGIVTNDAWNAFVGKYHNGSHCTKGINQEIGTIDTGDRTFLVNYKKPKIEDCYYRMLKPSEIKLAMAFENEYVVLGNSRDQVKQLGNAVTPPAMEFLIQRCIESLN